MNDEGAQQLAKVYDAIHSSTMEMQKLWLTTSVFTWRWWLTVCFAIVPWIVWLVVRKRESTARLMFAGVTVMAVSYTHLRAHETRHDLVCRLLLEKKKPKKTI